MKKEPGQDVCVVVGSVDAKSDCELVVLECMMEYCLVNCKDY